MTTEELLAAFPPGTRVTVDQDVVTEAGAVRGACRWSTNVLVVDLDSGARDVVHPSRLTREA